VGGFFFFFFFFFLGLLQQVGVTLRTKHGPPMTSYKVPELERPRGEHGDMNRTRR
jgi:hypothetical protein